MGLLSNTGLQASTSQKPHSAKRRIENTNALPVDLRCEVTSAPYILRPYAALYNPFGNNCSVLCNHPADSNAKNFVKRVKDGWGLDKKHYIKEDLSKIQDGQDKEKIRTPHDIVTEDMFRRYTETDSRPLTPAPTLASGKSRGSRRCLTPDQPHPKTTIVLDLRRSHSQETLYYHGYTTSDMTAGHTSLTNDRSTLPSLNLSEATHTRLIKGPCEHLPALASPLVLAKRAERPPKEPVSVRNVKKNQLKALNLNKATKGKSKGSTGDTPVSQRSKEDKTETEVVEGSDAGIDDAGSVELRRGKRRRKGRQSDRMTSAGLAAQTQQDPETQIAGIGTDSHNPSSRGSIAQSADDDIIPLPVIKTNTVKTANSFLDYEILKLLHREVDEEAIETEFDTKRRYVLEEAYRTRPDRPRGQEMQALLKEFKVPASSLGDWLHIPRVFSRQNAQFALPIDTNGLEALSPMQYAARFVTIKKSKQLLYLTVLRKASPDGFLIHKKDIEESLILMMGGTISQDQAQQFKDVMEWDKYQEEKNAPDEIKLTLLNEGNKRHLGDGDGMLETDSLKYRTWCGLCAICERMYGRFPSREKDPPAGIELSDFAMLETKLASLTIQSGLIKVLTAIRVR